MSYTSGQIQADHPTVIKAYDYRTAEGCCAYLIPHLKPHHTILDVGCGPGNITEGLAKLCPQGKTIGIDISQGVIDHATSRYYGPAVPNLSFEISDARSLKQFPDNSFDVIHAHGCLLHVADKVKSLETFLRVCKPGGIVAREALLYMGSDPDKGLKKKEWAQMSGYEKNCGRIFVSQSSQRMEVALRNFEGETGERAITSGFMAREQVGRFKTAWDEWEATDGHELVCPAADMLCFKYKEVTKTV
ncbi:UbiE family methyltransferase [Hyaloscypha sp. PMI_1271]|nr:UbiE family methyltransferase [Hyaloscypha sp. PMI_1271]